MNRVPQDHLDDRMALTCPSAGICRLLTHSDNHGNARPCPRSAWRSNAEKKTSLARRRGGGTTARARSETAPTGAMWHVNAPFFEQLVASRSRPLNDSITVQTSSYRAAIDLMNFDQAKALRLQQWRSTLDDHDFRMQNPETHRETLRSMAATLATEGLIDQVQQFDMDKMADAAYWHAVEEIQSFPDRYRGSSSYDVVKVGTDELWGTISRSIFNEAAEKLPGPPLTYGGKVYPNANGADLALSMSGETGRITGLSLTMSEGQLYRLIETTRIIDGETYEPLEDPEIYRALIDIAQVARECRNLHTFERLRPFIELARFCTCPSCLDRFGQCEDCPTCAGLGFLTKA